MSVASNIVEGSARRSTRAYVSFLIIARASAAEVDYLITLACDLRYLPVETAAALRERCNTLIPQLETLVQKMEQLIEMSGN